MLILDTTTRSLQFALDSAAASAQVQAVMSWTDNTSVAFTPGASQAQSNDTTPVTLVAAPAAATQRLVKFVNLYNADTATVNVTIKYNDNGTLRTMLDVALDPGESLVYSENAGWYVSSQLGQTKFLQVANSHQSDIQYVGLPGPPSAGTQTLTNQTTFAVYMGKAVAKYSQATMLFRATTAAVTVTWAEAAVLKGDVVLGGNPNLTLVNFVDISAIVTGTGIKTATIALSGINVGDPLWLAIACNATTPAQLRNLNFTPDTVATGLVVSLATTRPSTMAALTSFTAGTICPIWKMVKWQP